MAADPSTSPRRCAAATNRTGPGPATTSSGPLCVCTLPPLSSCSPLQPTMADAAVRLVCTPIFHWHLTDHVHHVRPSNATQQQSSHTSPTQGPAPVLPPPAGTFRSLTHCSPPAIDSVLGAPFYPSNGASPHNQSLPGLSGLTAQPPQAPSHMATHHPPSSEAATAAPTTQPPPQGPSYSLPGLSQTLQPPSGPALSQTNVDRERELRERETREREMMESHAAQQHAAQQDELMKREAEQRERDARERQQQEQVNHENHPAPIQIHQPVAVAPSTRTVHGPNGLLGQSGPLGGPTMTASNAPNNIFGGTAVQPAQQGETTPRMQHAVQPPQQPSMLMPFPGAPGAAAAMAMGQGQQPILNVRTSVAPHRVFRLTHLIGRS